MASPPRSGLKGNRRNDFTMEFPSDQQLENLETKSEMSTATDSKTCDDIYTILDDKNRAIEVLKRRLANQKLQLGYYLQKNFAEDQVRDFSSHCFPHLAEDNTQISLAMYKFLKDTGGKTRLAKLREKLTECSVRVHKALLRQEQLMRGGLSLELVPVDGEASEDCISVKDDEMRFAKKALGVAQLEISSRLLSVILNVREEMEMFRLCTESIVKLEEERNLLVDRVFSLPVEQRYDMRLAELDLEAREKHQEAQEVVSPDMATRVTSTMSISTNTSDADFSATQEPEVPLPDEKRNLGGVLRDMETEALQLLMMSERQKNEFVMALEDARMENQHLKERLKEMEDAASDERVMQLQEKCMNIETEVEEMRTTFDIEQTEKDKALKQLAIELCNKEASEHRLEQEVKNLMAALDVLREERNELQKKCEEEQMNTFYVQQDTSTDMLGNSEQQAQEMNDLTDLVEIQDEQIKDLLSIMSDLQVSVPLYPHSDIISTNNSSFKMERVEECEEPEEKEQPEKLIEEIMPSTQNKLNDNISELNDESDLDSAMFAPLEKQTPPEYVHFDVSSDAFKNENNVDEDGKNKVKGGDDNRLQDSDDDVCHIFFDSSSVTTNIHDEESSPLVTETTLKTEDITTTTRGTTPSGEKTDNQAFEPNKSDKSLRSGRCPSRRVFGVKKPIQILKQKSSGLATTSLRVEAFDKDGKSESMHAVLESSSPVDGLLELNNSSKLHLRLHCTSPQRNEYSLMTINEDEVDEEPCAFCPNENVSGDHIHKQGSPRSLVGTKSSKQSPKQKPLKIDKSTKLFLTKQLKKLKGQLRKVESSQGKAEVFHNFKQVYSNLFGGDSEDVSEGYS